ncbi:nardilysin-like [Lotus japonicus]|uniref:nardilysin-like n=1 Tax=Lotus japonicus TaxID=34305 RepID=UPI00258BA193|nr:nardilysin-like [Lotus japonicus]
MGMPSSPTITFSSDDVVVKSPNDRRLYRFIQLHNGLQALLVHDPEIYPEGPPKPVPTDNEEEEGSEVEVEGKEGAKAKDAAAQTQTKKAAAAMCVGVGSFSDPNEAQGLAHFLEHMLFMGSEEFPDENEYDSYLSKHGGSSNGHTEAEHTCYKFEVKREYLKGALRRFSQFFISPLVKIEAMEREVLAVDSEFNKVLQYDHCRLQQLQRHTSALNHPLNKFSCGNKKSLVDAMENGSITNLREKLLKFYEDYYHAGLMKLVVIGGESLNVLESWVVELFSTVKNGPQVNPEFIVEGPMWKSGKVYRLEAVKDINILSLAWTLPSLDQDYLEKPDDYLAYLLRNEGRGSLIFFLRARGWATSLFAGIGNDGMYWSSIAYVFVISICLTDSGIEKMYDIIGFVYQYLKLLRQVSPQEWIFKELQNMGNMKFRFAEEQPQDDYAAELAENLLLYLPEHVIYGDYMYETWDEQLLQQVLGFFIPENMRVDVVSKFLKSSQDFKYETWFGSRYVEEDISQNLMKLWRNPPEIDASFHLPSKNEFIPSDFSIRAGEDDSANLTSPRCIVDEALIKFWYKPDSTFKVPRSNTYFQINLKGSRYDNVKSCVLSELFIHLLKDELNEIIYQASVAKLETRISYVGDHMLELKVSGFNEKLPVLLSKILSVTRSFMPTEDRYKVIKEDVMKRALKNTNMKPLSHSSYLRLQILCESFYDADDKLHCLNDLFLDDLNAFIPELRSQLYIEGLCHGNLSEDEAINISNIFKINFPLNINPPLIKLRHARRIVCLPSSANLVRDVGVKNKFDKNSAVELYFQIEQDFGMRSMKLKALIDLVEEIVKEPLFNQLRTKEQLGYVVDCSSRVTIRVLGFCFHIQSSEYNPVYLQGRIDNFINGLEELLDGLDDDSFENYKSGLMAKLLEKDPSLTYESNRLWNQILDKRYIFDVSKKKAEELRNISKNDVVEWYKTYLKPSSPKCRRLLVRVWGCNTDLKDNAEALSKSMQVIITDPTAFKKESVFYPS